MKRIFTILLVIAIVGVGTMISANAEGIYFDENGERVYIYEEYVDKLEFEAQEDSIEVKKYYLSTKIDLWITLSNDSIVLANAKEDWAAVTMTISGHPKKTRHLQDVLEFYSVFGDVFDENDELSYSKILLQLGIATTK